MKKIQSEEIILFKAHYTIPISKSCVALYHSSNKPLFNYWLIIADGN